MIIEVQFHDGDTDTLEVPGEKRVELIRFRVAGSVTCNHPHKAHECSLSRVMGGPGFCLSPEISTPCVRNYRSVLVQRGDDGVYREV